MLKCKSKSFAQDSLIRYLLFYVTMFSLTKFGKNIFNDCFECEIDSVPLLLT